MAFHYAVSVWRFLSDLSRALDRTPSAAAPRTGESTVTVISNSEDSSRRKKNKSVNGVDFCATYSSSLLKPS